jgi:hypothetical protein
MYNIFSRIKILAFVGRIMPQQLFKLNYFVLEIITKAIHIIFVKTHVYNSKYYQMSLKAYYKSNFVKIYLLGDRLMQLFFLSSVFTV